MPARDAWTEAWQKHWRKVGTPGYELPAGGPDRDEREFLTERRTPEGERARLSRINDEFESAFRALFHVGPAVTVFGSARFSSAARSVRFRWCSWAASSGRACACGGSR